MDEADFFLKVFEHCPLVAKGEMIAYNEGGQYLGISVERVAERRPRVEGERGCICVIAVIQKVRVEIDRMT